MCVVVFLRMFWSETLPGGLTAHIRDGCTTCRANSQKLRQLRRCRCIFGKCCRTYETAPVFFVFSRRQPDHDELYEGEDAPMCFEPHHQNRTWRER